MLRLCRETIAGEQTVHSTGNHLLTALILTRAEWLTDTTLLTRRIRMIGERLENPVTPARHLTIDR